VSVGWRRAVAVRQVAVRHVGPVAGLLRVAPERVLLHAVVLQVRDAQPAAEARAVQRAQLRVCLYPWDREPEHSRPEAAQW